MIRKLMHVGVVCLILAALPTLLAAASQENDPVQAGYVIITPTPSTGAGLVVFETFGERIGNATKQAGVLPSDMTTSAMLFVSASGRLSRDVGIAIANPGIAAAPVTLTLNDDTGKVVATSSFQLDAGKQTAQYVTQLFGDQKSVPQDFIGTLYITSKNPVGIMGLRFRGENFSTLPATSLSGPIPVPANGPIGGSGAVILAQFAAGGGWESEIVLANSGSSDLTVRVDLFKQDGTALTTTLNGTSGFSFPGIKIPGGGVVVLTSGKQNGDSDF